jgi:type II secretory pathway component GspD/PulD (secretin)
MKTIIPLVFFTIFLSVVVFAQVNWEEEFTGTTMEIIKPSYISPSDLITFLCAQNKKEDIYYFQLDVQENLPPVQIRFNDAANIIVLTGTRKGISITKKLIKAVDVPPSQIIIETKIIEISQEEIKDLGIDWEDLLKSANPYISYDYTKEKYKSILESKYEDDFSKTDRSARYLREGMDLRFDYFLHIIEETGKGTVYNAPRIVTVNNRQGNILDGQRVTYVSRYSSYSNLFETQTMDAGLNLNVLPSLGEKGYLTLEIVAKMTTLGESISGSPVEEGQMLENTVVVKDGQTILLGGFRRTKNHVTDRKLPILGSILPFLFSRKITTKETKEIFIVLTPHIINLASQPVDKELQNLLESEEKKLNKLKKEKK